MKTYQVISRGNQWALKRQGASRATAIFNTKLDAIKYITSNEKFDCDRLIVHERDGTVEKVFNF